MLEITNHASLSDSRAPCKHSRCQLLPAWLDRVALTAPGIAVWQAHLDDDAEMVFQCEQLLSPDELSRSERFHHDSDRRRFVVARGALRMLVGAYLNMPYSRITFGYEKYGKPFVLGSAAHIHFNVSHSGERALFALSGKYMVGVDIEHLTREIDYDALARRFFTARERSVLQRLPKADRKRAFFGYWTHKEAIVKAIGNGLSMPLSSVEVALERDAAPRLLTFNGSVRDVVGWTLYGVDIDSDYIGAVAAYRGANRGSTGS